MNQTVHELAICQALLEQVTQVAADNRAEAVGRIRVRNGPLSGVDAHSLEQAFAVACLGTVAEQAELMIEPEPIRVRCTVCGQESAAVANVLLCAKCGDWRTQVISGDALLLVSVELE